MLPTGSRLTNHIKQNRGRVMENMNRSFIYSLINDGEHSAFLRIFKGCDVIKEELEKTNEYKVHRDIYNIYSGLDFLFHGKYVEYTMKKSFFGYGIYPEKLKDLIENPSDEFRKIIARHVCYSKGYEESKEFVNDNYDFKLCSLGGSVSDYIGNNLNNAMKILKTQGGKW